MPHSTAVESYSFQQYGLASGQSAFLQAQPHQTLQQHGLQPHSQVVPVTAVETHPALRQSQHLLRRQQIPHHQASYGAGPSTTPAAATYHQDYSQGRKRSRGDREDLHLDIQGLSALQDVGDSSATDVSIELTPHGHHAQPQTQLYQTTSQQQTLTGQTQQHHHHRLPNQPAPPKMRRMGVYGDPTSPSIQHGPPSVVGQEGMPPPAPRPRGPKLKFTPEDDQLLVDLKEKKNLTWKQIADFFPGRSSGTLQVRYCTKLKAKTTVWTDDMVSLFSLYLLLRRFEVHLLRQRLPYGYAMQCAAPRLASLHELVYGSQGLASCSEWKVLLFALARVRDSCLIF